MKLNRTILSKIRNQIPVPSYDKQSLKTGIVHIGVGGFHRSHQAYYIHHLLEKYSDWAICGVGLREADRNISNILNKQDCLCLLYTSPSPRDRTRSRMPSSA